MKTTTRRLLFLLMTAVAAGCSRPEEAPPTATTPAEEELPPPVYESALPEDMRSLVDRVFTGDLDEMIKRRLIRVAMPFNRSFYFVDKGVQRGLSYEYLTLFEEQLNKKLNTGNLKVHVVPMPMPRDMLLPSLQVGKGRPGRRPAHGHARTAEVGRLHRTRHAGT